MSYFHPDVKHIHLIPVSSEIPYIKNIAESLGANPSAHILREDTLSKFQDRVPRHYMVIYVAQDDYVLAMDRISDDAAEEFMVNNSDLVICH